MNTELTQEKSMAEGGVSGAVPLREYLQPLYDLMQSDPDAFRARMKAAREVKWKRVIGPEDCTADEAGTLICPVCDFPFEFCNCPALGEEQYEFRTTDGVLEARPKSGNPW